MADEHADDAPLVDPDEPGWAEEIKRLQGARGDRLAQQVAEADRKDPPVE